MARDGRRLRRRESSLLAATDLLAALAEAAPDLARLEAAGLAIVQHDERTGFVIVPDDVGADAVIAALMARGARVSPLEAAPSADAAPRLAAGAAALLHAAALAPDGEERAAPVADETLVVVEGDEDRLAEIAPALCACVPASRVGGFAGDSGAVLVFHVADSASAGSALAGFREGPFAGAVRCLRLYAAGPAFVCLGTGAPPKTALQACGRVLAAVMAADGDARPAVAVTASVDGAVTVHGFELPRGAPAGLVGGPPNLVVTERRLVAGDGLMERLRAAIAQRGDGHAVRLDRLPAQARRRPASRIRDEIARLEAEWQIAVGLQSAQVRLLRFDHGQLDAMVDALRRLPAAETNRVSYAFAAAADYPIGCHYLKFSARDVAPLRPFIETVWRASCGGGPICYWVDPTFARLHDSGAVKSLVMVPEDHVFSPPFHAFHPEDLDRQLEAAVASWAATRTQCTGAAPPGAAAAAPRAEPIYVFSPGAGGTVRLEVLEGKDFRALTTAIGFVNDCLVLTERIDVDDFIRTGAGVARRHEILTRLAEDTAARTRDLDSRAQALETTLSAQLGDYLGWLTSEVEALSEFIAGRGEEVERLAAAADDVLARLAAACGEAAALKFTTGLMTEGFESLDGERQTLERSLTGIISATSDTIASGTARLEDARRRLAALETRLKRWRR